MKQAFFRGKDLGTIIQLIANRFQLDVSGSRKFGVGFQSKGNFNAGVWNPPTIVGYLDWIHREDLFHSGVSWLKNSLLNEVFKRTYIYIYFFFLGFGLSWNTENIIVLESSDLWFDADSLHICIVLHIYIHIFTYIYIYLFMQIKYTCAAEFF